MVEKRSKRMEENIGCLIDSYKRNNLQIIGIPEVEKNGKGELQVKGEIIAKDFPTVWSRTVAQIQEPQRIPNEIRPNRTPPIHVVIKMAKAKRDLNFLKH